MLAHLFAGCLAAFAMIPDVIPSGYHGISLDLRFEAQALLEHCCTQHVVKKGETLSKIATTRLWGAGAVEDIIAINPGIKADKIKVGQRIWLPPTHKAARILPKTYAFNTSGWTFGGGGKPFAALESHSPPRYGMLSLLLVPEMHLAAYNASKNDTRLIKALIKDLKIPQITADCSGRLARDGDPTKKRVDTVTIHRDQKGKFSASVKTVCYDKKGKVITPETLKKFNGKKGTWLLLLPAVGAGWLLLRRRRATVAPATA